MTKIRPSQMGQGGATTNQGLVWNGTLWVPNSIARRIAPAVSSTGDPNITNISGQSLNQFFATGAYNGDNLGQAPNTNWHFLQVYAHSGGEHWQRQILYDMTGLTNNEWHRRCSGANPTLSGSWSAWALRS